jgi:hypothetical protein
MIIKESRLRSEIRKMLLAESIKDRHGYAVNSIGDVKWSSRKIDIPKDLNPFIGSSKAFESWYNDGEMTSTFRVSKNVGMPDEKSFLIKNDIFFPVGSFVIIPELWSKGLEKVVYQVAPPGIYQLSAEQVPGKEKNDSVPVVAIRDPAKPGMPGIENIGIAFLRKVGGPKADLASASNAANDYMLDYKGHNEDAPGADVSQSAARASVRRRPGESTPRPPARPRDVTLSPEERAKLLGISENKLRRIIREALLREANWANDADQLLQYLDNVLTGLDIATGVASLTPAVVPAFAANRTINIVSAAVDLAQVFTSLAKDPPDYEAAWVNGFSAIISVLVSHAVSRAITSGALPAAQQAWKRRELIVTLATTAVDWWVSREKITPTDAAKLKEVIKQNPEPDVGESDGSLEPDVGESDGSPDPVLPTLPKPPSQPRTPSPRLSSPASDCPVSQRFAFEYTGWSGSIKDMGRKPPANVTVDLNVGSKLGDTGWKIESVKSDQEGRPTRVKIIFTDGKCLTVLPLNSFE